MVALILAAAALQGPSAQEIIERSGHFSGITAHSSRFYQLSFRTTENGHTYFTRVIAKAPNKLLVRNEFPWRGVVRYQGFDGARPWISSNTGDGVRRRLTMRL